MPKVRLTIELDVTMSEEFLAKFKLKEHGNQYHYNSYKDRERGNLDLGYECVNKCFRNNSRSVHYVKATEIKEEDDA
tara:strand:+ start:1310 stop:1540 length:231 start_codon:yes stop_codon:yes gene_type:complete